MATPQNSLIASLPRRDRQRLLARCQPIELVLGDILCESGKPTLDVYFPVDGFISLVTEIDQQPALEVGMIGREGMLGVQLVLGVAQQPLRAVVQGAGSCWRIGSSDFKRELAASLALQRGLNRYLYVLMAQLATSAACLRFHEIGPRLARWLLMTQDRAHADRFRITHEFLSFMLGVRRSGITVAAGALQSSGLIEYQRGTITVRNRPGLEAAACSCYAEDLRTYKELLTAPSP